MEASLASDGITTFSSPTSSSSVQDTKNFECIFTSDIHGNTRQYESFFRTIIQLKPRLAIIGGDLFPKGSFQSKFKYANCPVKSLEFQRQYFIENLVPKFLDCKKLSPKTIFLIIFGNADFSGNKAEFNSILESTDLQTNVLLLLNQGTSIFFQDFNVWLNVYGMSYILGSTRKTKDFERFDDLQDLIPKKSTHYDTPSYLHPSCPRAKPVTLNGLVSNYKELESKFEEDFSESERQNISFIQPNPPTHYGPEMMFMNLPSYEEWTANMKHKYSIDYEISKFSKKSSFIKHNLITKSDDDAEFPLLKTVNLFISHQPPHGTCNDLVRSGHVGSQSLKKWFGILQIDISLHGHTHSTVDLAGKYLEKIPFSTNEREEEEISPPELFSQKKTKKLDGKKMDNVTYSFSSGNDPKKRGIRLVCFDLLNPEKNELNCVANEKEMVV